MTEHQTRALQQRITEECPTCAVEVYTLRTTTGRTRWVLWVTQPVTGAKIVVAEPGDWTNYVPHV